VFQLLSKKILLIRESQQELHVNFQHSQAKVSRSSDYVLPISTKADNPDERSWLLNSLERHLSAIRVFIFFHLFQTGKQNELANRE